MLINQRTSTHQGSLMPAQVYGQPGKSRATDCSYRWPGKRLARIASRENWRVLQLLTRGQPLLIYSWHSRLQSIPKPHQLKGGQIITRTDNAVQFLCGFTPWGSVGSVAHSSTAFTLFPCCSFCLLCICIKSTQVVHRSAARLTELQTKMPMNSSGDTSLCFVTLSFQIDLRPPGSSWWSSEISSDDYQPSMDLWPWIMHSQQTVWLEKSGNVRRSVEASMNSPILLVKGCVFSIVDFPTDLLWFSKNNILQ